MSNSPDPTTISDSTSATTNHHNQQPPPTVLDADSMSLVEGMSQSQEPLSQLLSGPSSRSGTPQAAPLRSPTSASNSSSPTFLQRPRGSSTASRLAANASAKASGGGGGGGDLKRDTSLGSVQAALDENPPTPGLSQGNPSFGGRPGTAGSGGSGRDTPLGGGVAGTANTASSQYRQIEARRRAASMKEDLQKLQLERPRSSTDPLGKPKLPEGFLDSGGSGKKDDADNPDLHGGGGGLDSLGGNPSSSVPDFLGMYSDKKDNLGNTISGRASRGGGGGPGGSGNKKGGDLGSDLAWGGGGGSLLPHQTNPLFANPLQSQPFFTLQNTNSLQSAMNNLLKAVVTMSEDQKSMKEELQEALSRSREREEEVDGKLAKVTARIEENYVLKHEYNDFKYEEQRAREKLSTQTITLEETTTKDRAMLLSRISSLEPFMANLQSDLTALRNSTVPEATFKGAVDQLEAKHIELEGFVTKQQRLLEFQFEDVQAVEEQHHLEVQGHLKAHTEKLDEHTKLLDEQRDATAEAAANAVELSQSSHIKMAELDTTVKRSILNLATSEAEIRAQMKGDLELLIEKVNTESDVRCQKLDGKQMMSESKMEVRLATLAEKQKSFEEDLGDCKSELACVNEIISSDEKNHGQFIARMEATTDGLQEELRTCVHRLDKQLKVQEGMRSEFGDWRDELDSDLNTKIQTLSTKLLRDSKEALVTQLRDSEGQILDQVFHQFREELNYATKAMKKQFESSFKEDRDSFASRVNELSDFATQGLTDLAQSLTTKIQTVRGDVGLLHYVFGIDKKKIPATAMRQYEDHVRTLENKDKGNKPIPKSEETRKLEAEQDWANRMALNRYLRSLPWVTGAGSSEKTPVDTNRAGSPYRSSAVGSGGGSGSGGPQSRVISPPKPSPSILSRLEAESRSITQRGLASSSNSSAHTPTTPAAAHSSALDASSLSTIKAAASSPIAHHQPHSLLASSGGTTPIRAQELIEELRAKREKEQRERGAATAGLSAVATSAGANTTGADADAEFSPAAARAASEN